MTTKSRKDMSPEELQALRARDRDAKRAKYARLTPEEKKKLHAKNAEWVKANPDKQRAHRAKYMASIDKEAHLAKCRERNKKRRQENPEKQKEYAARWKAKNLERSKAMAKAAEMKRREQNPEKYLQKQERLKQKRKEDYWADPEKHRAEAKARHEAARRAKGIKPAVRRTPEELAAWKKMYNAKYAKENREAIRAKQKAWEEANADRVKETRKKYYVENKEAIAKNFAEYRKNNRETLRQYARRYYEENREEINEKGHEYYLKNAAIISERGRVYRAKNPEITRMNNEKQKLKRTRRKAQIEARQSIYCGTGFE